MSVWQPVPFWKERVKKIANIKPLPWRKNKKILLRRLSSTLREVQFNILGAFFSFTKSEVGQNLINLAPSVWQPRYEMPHIQRICIVASVFSAFTSLTFLIFTKNGFVSAREIYVVHCSSLWTVFCTFLAFSQVITFYTIRIRTSNRVIFFSSSNKHGTHFFYKFTHR